VRHNAAFIPFFPLPRQIAITIRNKLIRMSSNTAPVTPAVSIPCKFKDYRMNIRRFELGDESALLDVFHSSIHLVAARDYTEQQLSAWAPDSLDQGLWALHMQALAPFVVEEGGRIIGYADLQRSGYIDHFFVAGEHARRGIGRLLMERIHQEARTLGLSQLTAQVSLSAEPFFLHFGFQVVERRTPVLRGVTLDNALMCKHLR
jgi:putative acetyltransferase